MRIIGGQAKGRRIAKPQGCEIRPTSDRVKEALFNLLQRMDGCRFLDLFAGTGNIGLEALSRGASQVIFVEQDPRCIEAIRRNARHCGFTDGYECLAQTVDDALRRLSRRGDVFDVIFMDPPYDRGLVQEVLTGIERHALLTEEGIVVVQHSARESVGCDAEMLILEDERRYGDTLLSFWSSKQ